MYLPLSSRFQIINMMNNKIINNDILLRISGRWMYKRIGGVLVKKDWSRGRGKDWSRDVERIGVAS